MGNVLIVGCVRVIGSVGTCSVVMLCEIILHLLIRVQNTGVIGQGIDCELSEGDRIVSKHVAV
jgi:hypothetical protein